jgi:hypothetical protein
MLILLPHCFLKPIEELLSYFITDSIPLSSPFLLTQCAVALGLSKSSLQPLQAAASKLLHGIDKKTPSPIDVDFLQLALLAG